MENKTTLLQAKLVSLYKIDEKTMTEQQRIMNREKITALLERNPIESIHLDDMRNRLSLQKRKKKQLENHKSPIDMADAITDAMTKLNNEIMLLEEIINLYQDIQNIK